ncbi:hypothetical protein J7439_09030 [Salinisphaera sp. G21_0]|nr:hypothetical protein [Salinisphaera sp. G21_0]
MPHCIIEYSRPPEAIVSPEALMERVHQGVVSSGLFDASAIKVRALPYDHFDDLAWFSGWIISS